jgi:hypothetical protein
MLIMQVCPDSGHRSRLQSHIMTPVVPRCPMVTTRSCDSTHSNMWVPILPPTERTPPATRSTKGSSATVGVLYPGYRGTPVMTQPRNSARDTPELPQPRSEASSTETASTRTLNTATNIQARGLHIPQERRHRSLQWQDNTVPDRTDSKSLSSQVKPAPHNIDSRNLLECRPP